MNGKEMVKRFPLAMCGGFLISWGVTHIWGIPGAAMVVGVILIGYATARKP